MFGRIIGGYRNYWCLFGDAINMAARLASLSCKSEWKDRVEAAAQASLSKGAHRETMWHSDPELFSVACSAAARSALVDSEDASSKEEGGSRGADEGEKGAGQEGEMPGYEALYVMEDLGAFELKGKGLQHVYAARIAPWPGTDTVQGDPQMSASLAGINKGSKVAFTKAIHAHAEWQSSFSSRSTGVTSIRSGLSLAVSAGGKGAKMYAVPERAVKKSNETAFGKVAGVWTCKLPGGLSLVLPCGSWMQQHARKLDWSKTCLTLKCRSQQAKFRNECYTKGVPLCVSFALMSVSVSVMCSGLLSLDRFSVSPLDVLRPFLLYSYLLLIAVSLLAFLAAFALTLHNYSEACDLEPPATSTLSAHMRKHKDQFSCACYRALRNLQVVCKLACVVLCLYAWHRTKADGWTLHFPYLQLVAMSQFNGLSYRQNFWLVWTSFGMVIPHVLTLRTGVIATITHFIFAKTCVTCVRKEEEERLAQWIMVQVAELQRLRLHAVCCTLLPAEMVEWFVASSYEPLQMMVYESKNLVLQLDLVNYTGLTARIPVHELATYVQMLHLEFDALVEELTPFGVFKMDTIGDAYVVAAWLGEDNDKDDAIVARKVVELGHSFIDIVVSAQPVAFECRVGVAAGQVCAGMLGKLQPRFQLIGEAMSKAAHCEALADINTVLVSPEVRSLMEAGDSDQSGRSGLASDAAGDEILAMIHHDAPNSAGSDQSNLHRFPLHTTQLHPQAADQSNSGSRPPEVTGLRRRGPRLASILGRGGSRSENMAVLASDGPCVRGGGVERENERETAERDPGRDPLDPSNRP